MAVSLRAAWRGAGDSKALTEELMVFVQARSAVGDAPDALRILDELPRSPLHKVLRREVREMLTRARAGA
jgi:acyl-coenzyme A synthetase/AMP-(fatty) acid ligase